MTDSDGEGRRQTKRCGRKSNRDGDHYRGKLRTESTVAIIDRLLLTPVRTNLNGKESMITALEAIMYQLLQKEMAGDAKASRVLLQYGELVNHRADRRLEITFVDSDYTQSLTDWKAEGGNERS